jgi:4-amino-4-deoxy-L-arabinose transferase-like glycosyltransferase
MYYMKRSTAIILALLLLAFGLRVWNLSGPSFWWDEAYTVQTARYDWATFWQLQEVARHPPLYFLIVRAWGSLIGWSEFSVRFLSVGFSLLGAALVFQVTRRLFDRRAGMWALAVAAVAPALVVYAQESRMYALTFMLAAATLYYGYRVFDFDARTNRPRLTSVALLICEALLLLTHYFALPFVAAFNLIALANLIYHRARRSEYARWLGGQMLAALPVMIWVVMLGLAQGGLSVADEARIGLVEFARQIAILWASGVRDLDMHWDVLAMLAVMVTLWLSISAWLYRARRAVALLAFAAAALGCTFAFASVLTSFHPRYVLLFSLPAYVLAGAALAHDFTPARHRRYVAGGVTLIAVSALLVMGWSAATDPRYAKDDARSVAQYLKQHAAAEDVILMEAYDFTQDYYDHGPAPVKMIMSQDEPGAFAELSAAVGNAKRVWFLHWPVATQDPRGYWPFLLAQSGTLKSRTAFHGYDLLEYEVQSSLREPELTPASPAGMITQHSTIGGQAANALSFALTWQTPVKFFDPARVSVRLIDARGNTLSARDAALLDERGRTTDHWDTIVPVTNYYVLPIPPGTPPGTYTVTAQLYNARDVLANEVVGTIDRPRRLNTSDPYRTLSGYQWQKPANHQIADGLSLVVFAVSPNYPRKPMPIDVTLRWRKIFDVTTAAPRLRLAQADRVWTEVGSDLLEREYPIGLWVDGETVIDRLKIDYPPVRGPIDLQIGQGDQWTTLTTLQLDESQMMFDPPAMQHTQSAQFGDFAQLLGYDLQSVALSATRPLDLKLYWRATNTEPITTPYTVFTQILAPDGHLVAQDDAPPNPPTTQWLPGQIVTDRHAIKVVDPAYRGPATLIVGWYNSATIERAPVNSGGDHIVLQVPVRIEN